MTADYFVRFTKKTIPLYLSVFVFGLACVWLIKYHWNRRKLYKFSWSMDGPFAWPIIGNALLFAGSTEDILNSLVHLLTNYCSPCKGWLGNRLFVFVHKPRDLEIIFNSPKTLGKEDLYKFTIPVVGTGLFSASVEKWRKHRKIIMPTFNQKILDSFMPVFVEQSNIFVENLKNFVGKSQFDIFEIMSLLSLDIVCESAMGIKVYAQSKESRFVKLANRAMSITFTRMFKIQYHIGLIFNLSPLGKELKNVTKEMHDFTFTVIRNKRKELEEKIDSTSELTKQEDDDIKIPKRKAFLELLIELTMEGTKFTDKELLDEVVTLMIAGSDTTASMNSFTCMMLGAYPEVQDKVYEELQDIFGDSDRFITTDDLPKLQYLERVIKETMRLFPVGPAIVRSVSEDLQLDTCTIPAGASVVLGIIQTHRNPDIWPDPLKFDPDRFLPEEVAKRHPYSYVPFSGGPRNCIGTRYANMAMKAVLATFLRTYRIKADLKVEDIKLKADLMMKPVNGYKIEIELRKTNKITM